jgi:CopG family transcriptional regulator, nickel-responsive regulator
MPELTRTAIAMEKGLMRDFEAWMAARGYTNRSEAIRDLIRSALVEQEWSDPKAAVVAMLSIIYDHERRELAQQLTHLQHADHHAILCSQHIHLDHHNCLEAIILRGTAAQLRRISDAIIATRGVRAGKLTLMSMNY